jgi:hypothetical protein
MRVSPVDPLLHLTLVGMAYAFIELRRFDEAIVAGKKALRQNGSREFAVASSVRRKVSDLHGDMGQVGEFGQSLPIMRCLACPAGCDRDDGAENGEFIGRPRGWTPRPRAPINWTKNFSMHGRCNRHDVRCRRGFLFCSPAFRACSVAPRMNSITSSIRNAEKRDPGIARRLALPF